MTIKQITVVPGMGVEVNTKGEWEVARKSFEQALIDRSFTLWDGGECPVDDGQLVDIVTLEGKCYLGQKVDSRLWSHESLGSDIIAYRLHQEQESQPAAELFDEMHEFPHIAGMSPEAKREISTLTARNADLEAQVEQLTAQLAKIKELANV